MRGAVIAVMCVEWLVIGIVIVIRVVIVMIGVVIVIGGWRVVVNRIAVVFVGNRVKGEMERRDEDGPEDEDAGDEGRERAMSQHSHHEVLLTVYDARRAADAR